MKKSGKIILGVFFSFVGILIFSQFQNCSPASSSGSFNIGSATFTVAAVVVQPQPVTPSTAFTITSTMSISTDPNIVCTGSILGAGGAIVATLPSTPISGSVCFMQSTGPAQGTYGLTITATDSTTNQTASNTTVFTSGAAGNLPLGALCGYASTPGTCGSVAAPAAPATCTTNCADHAGGTPNYSDQVSGSCTFGYACN